MHFPTLFYICPAKIDKNGTNHILHSCFTRSQVLVHGSWFPRVLSFHVTLPSRLGSKIAPNSEVPVTPYTPKGLVHGIIDIAFQNRQHLELLHDGRLERSQDLLEVVLGVGADILQDFSDPKQVMCRSSAWLRTWFVHIFSPWRGPSGPQHYVAHPALSQRFSRSGSPKGSLPNPLSWVDWSLGAKAWRDQDRKGAKLTGNWLHIVGWLAVWYFLMWLHLRFLYDSHKI